MDLRFRNLLVRLQILFEGSHLVRSASELLVVLGEGRVTFTNAEVGFCRNGVETGRYLLYKELLNFNICRYHQWHVGNMKNQI